MAESIIKNIYGKNYIQSEKIRVFPTAWRGTAQNNKHINIESMLSTENSLRHLSPVFSKNSYVLSCEQDPTAGSYTVCCVIGGYYFEIYDIPEETFSDYDKLWIYTYSIPLAGTDTAATEETTTRLGSFHVDLDNNHDKYLDIQDSSSTTYYFTGLIFTDNETAQQSWGVTGDLICLDLAKNSKKLAIDYSKIESVKTDEFIAGNIFPGRNTAGELLPTAVRINDPNNVSNYNYSTILGENNKASATNQLVFGKYNNITNASSFVEMVGWGTSTSRKNIRTLNSSGNEILAGSITAKGAAITGTTTITGAAGINTNTTNTKYATSIGNTDKILTLKGSQITAYGITTIASATSSEKGKLEILQPSVTGGDAIKLTGITRIIGATNINTSSNNGNTDIGNINNSLTLKGSQINLNTVENSGGVINIGNNAATINLVGSSINAGTATISGTITNATDAVNAINVPLSQSGSGTNSITVKAGTGSTTFTVNDVEHATKATNDINGNAITNYAHIYTGTSSQAASVTTLKTTLKISKSGDNLYIWAE